MKRGASKKTSDGAKRAKTAPVESLPTPGSDDGNVPRLAGPGNVVLPPSAFQVTTVMPRPPAQQASTPQPPATTPPPHATAPPRRAAPTDAFSSA